jgi:hypothetical protein
MVGSVLKTMNYVYWFSDNEAGLCLDQCFGSHLTNLQFFLVHNKQLKTNLI